MPLPAEGCLKLEFLSSDDGRYVEGCLEMPDGDDDYVILGSLSVNLWERPGLRAAFIELITDAVREVIAAEGRHVYKVECPCEGN